MKGLGKMLFANSGSEANDQAAKIVWFYSNALGRPREKKIIGRVRGYHGITVFAGSMTSLQPNHTVIPGSSETLPMGSPTPDTRFRQR